MTGVLLGKTIQELEQLLPASEPPFRARQLYEAIYRRQASSFEEMTTLPQGLRTWLTEHFQLGWPRIAQELVSSDGTRKYLLELNDGRTIETVFIPEEDRDTVCISTQVGCPVSCRFCLTALMGLERNLTAGEIVGQVLLTCRLRGLRPQERQFNIVMMGMGEPLLNLANVLKATELLCDPRGFGLSQRRITVSTAGIIPKIEELARAPVRPKLAISLNAPSEELRRELMPITRKYHLKDLIETCRRYPLRPWEHLTFEYVLLRNVNDSATHARELVRLLSGLRCKVNLIALNPGPGIPYQTPEPERVLQFQEIVKQHFPCFIRKPRGRDIFAACGQLKRMVEVTTPAPTC